MWKYVAILAALCWSTNAQQGGSFIGTNEYSFSYGSRDGVHKIQAQSFNGKWQVKGSIQWLGNDGIRYTTNFFIDSQGVRSGVTETALTTPRPPSGFGAFQQPSKPPDLSEVPISASPPPQSITAGTASSILGIGK